MRILKWAVIVFFICFTVGCSTNTIQESITQDRTPTLQELQSLSESELWFELLKSAQHHQRAGAAGAQMEREAKIIGLFGENFKNEYYKNVYGISPQQLKSYGEIIKTKPDYLQAAGIKYGYMYELARREFENGDNWEAVYKVKKAIKMHNGLMCLTNPSGCPTLVRGEVGRGFTWQQMFNRGKLRPVYELHHANGDILRSLYKRANDKHQEEKRMDYLLRVVKAVHYFRIGASITFSAIASYNQRVQQKQNERDTADHVKSNINELHSKFSEALVLATKAKTALETLDAFIKRFKRKKLTSCEKPFFKKLETKKKEVKTELNLSDFFISQITNKLNGYSQIQSGEITNNKVIKSVFNHSQELLVDFNSFLARGGEISEFAKNELKNVQPCIEQLRNKQQSISERIPHERSVFFL